MIDIQLWHVSEFNCTSWILSLYQKCHANDAKVPAKKNLISMLAIKIICISCWYQCFMKKEMTTIMWHESKRWTLTYKLWTIFYMKFWLKL